jgi:hypothetical protein
MRSARHVTAGITFGLALTLMACSAADKPAAEQQGTTASASRGPVPTRIRADCALKVDPDGATEVFLAYGPLDERNGVRIIEMWRQAATAAVQASYVRCLNEDWNFK